VAEPEHLLPVQNQLGESPIWAPEEKALYWVDWGDNPIYRYEPASGDLQVTDVDRPMTALARRAAGGWLAVAQTELAFWDPLSNRFTPIVGLPDPEKSYILYNDSTLDRQGRLLVGTFNSKDPFAPDASLYRLDPDGSLHWLDSGFATVNGLAVSPDGRRLYVTDMRHHRILVYDYEPGTGTLGNRRLFAQVGEHEGIPDGLIVDAEGFVWSTHWAGWKLSRYAPGGEVGREIRFPVQHVISCAFGGERLDEMYVTTAWYGFDAEERSQQPAAGDLYRVKAGVLGLVKPSFAG
jgi:sugar lactone lactonase YvrE